MGMVRAGARVVGGNLMTGMPPKESGEPTRKPSAFLSLISVALSELRRDLNQLCDSGWDEPMRRRAHELAEALFDACERERLPELGALIRPMANLTRLPAAQAVPVLRELRVEFGGLLRSAEQQLATHLSRYIG